MGIPKSWSVLAFSGCFFCAWATESLCFNEDLGFTREICCFPSSLGGNPACWDDFFYFEKCCVHFDAKDHSKEIETQIKAQTYLQRCSQGKKDIFCDIAAVQISRDITSHLEALERNRWTWPMWQRHHERRSKGKHAGKISKMNNTCNEVELCQLVLLRSWDIETRRGLVSLPDGPEKVAWCTHQASILRALDPDRFSELNSDSVQVDTYYVRWLVRCQEMQKARLVFGLSGMSFEGEPSKTNTKKPKVAVHLAVAGKAAIDFAHFVDWWRCYAEKHDYHFFMDQEVLAGDLLGPVHATGPLSGLLPRDESGLTVCLVQMALCQKAFGEGWCVMVDHCGSRHGPITRLWLWDSDHWNLWEAMLQWQLLVWCAFIRFSARRFQWSSPSPRQECRVSRWWHLFNVLNAFSKDLFLIFDVLFEEFSQVTVKDCLWGLAKHETIQKVFGASKQQDWPHATGFGPWTTYLVWTGHARSGCNRRSFIRIDVLRQWRNWRADLPEWMYEIHVSQPPKPCSYFRFWLCFSKLWQMLDDWSRTTSNTQVAFSWVDQSTWGKSQCTALFSGLLASSLRRLGQILSSTYFTWIWFGNRKQGREVERRGECFLVHCEDWL